MVTNAEVFQKIARVELVLQTICDYLNLKIPDPSELRAFITTRTDQRLIWWDVEEAKGERAGINLLDIIEFGSKPALFLSGVLQVQFVKKQEVPAGEDDRGGGYL